MVRIENHLGVIEISESYFSHLVGKLVTDCFGVAGMVTSDPLQGFKLKFIRNPVNKGVLVRIGGQGLTIDLHIMVTYGVNISEIVKSIAHKVKYNVEQATGLSVHKVNVHVDEMTES